MWCVLNRVHIFCHNTCSHWFFPGHCFRYLTKLRYGAAKKPPVCWKDPFHLSYIFLWIFGSGTRLFPQDVFLQRLEHSGRKRTWNLEVGATTLTVLLSTHPSHSCGDIVNDFGNTHYNLKPKHKCHHYSSSSSNTACTSNLMGMVGLACKLSATGCRLQGSTGWDIESRILRMYH